MTKWNRQAEICGTAEICARVWRVFETTGCYSGGVRCPGRELGTACSIAGPTSGPWSAPGGGARSARERATWAVTCGIDIRAASVHRVRKAAVRLAVGGPGAIGVSDQWPSGGVPLGQPLETGWAVLDPLTPHLLATTTTPGRQPVPPTAGSGGSTRRAPPRRGPFTMRASGEPEPPTTRGGNRPGALHGDPGLDVEGGQQRGAGAVLVILSDLLTSLATWMSDAYTT